MIALSRDECQTINMIIGCYPEAKRKHDFCSLPNLMFFIQINTKIVWERNQYLPPKCFTMIMISLYLEN